MLEFKTHDESFQSVVIKFFVFIVLCVHSFLGLRFLLGKLVNIKGVGGMCIVMFYFIFI